MEDSPKYDYNIVKIIYEKYHTPIRNEVLLAVENIIQLIDTIKRGEPEETLQYLLTLFFSENFTEIGQIGIPQIHTKAELTELIHTLNIRQLFVMLNNFRKNIDCFMFEMLILYKKNPEALMAELPFLNEDFIKHIIYFSENLLDADMEEFAKCYNEGFEVVECNRDNVPFFRQVQDDGVSYPNWNYSSICNLWFLTPYGVSNQMILKESKKNKIFDLVNNAFEKNPTVDKACAANLLKSYPLIEPLEQLEHAHLSKRGMSLENNTFAFAGCMFTTNPKNFTSALRRRNKKFSVLYTSGHTILMLIICKYFKNVNLVLILLGCMVWLVPYNHAIHEILLAAKELEVFKSYDYKKSNFENINTLLDISGLGKLDMVITSARRTIKHKSRHSRNKTKSLSPKVTKSRKLKRMSSV